MPPRPNVRDTAAVFREVVDSAQRRLVIAGYRFDTGEWAKDSMAPVARAIAQRGVAVTLIVDLNLRDKPNADVDKEFEAFLTSSWPFPEPPPLLFYDRRPLDGTEWDQRKTAMHAKCVVADGQRALVGSANFTNAGQNRNIEVGVLIDDPLFATHLTASWDQACEHGVLTRWARSP